MFAISESRDERGVSVRDALSDSKASVPLNEQSVAAARHRSLGDMLEFNMDIVCVDVHCMGQESSDFFEFGVIAAG